MGFMMEDEAALAGLEIQFLGDRKCYRKWVLGIAEGVGDLEFLITKESPVFTPDMCVGENVAFVADPFYVRWNNMHLLYYEMFSLNLNRGVIGVSTSTDLRNWRYLGIALQESFHLSYPCVFQLNNDLYILPETLGAGEMTLYKATSINTFERVRGFLPGHWADSTLLFHEGLFWIYTCSDPVGNAESKLFYSESIHGDWVSHPSNPIFVDAPHKARPAGKFIRNNGSLYRVAQDCSESYGRAINCYKVTNLSINEYAEEPHSEDGALFLDGSASDWSSSGVHHIDVIRKGEGYMDWLCVVDGSSMHKIEGF